MVIYVQSRGKPQQKDYQWLKVRKNNFVREIPPILKRISVSELIDSKKYSLVLARNDGELVLLVTGLSSERIDFMNRPIRNSIAWVAQYSPENEKIMRSLAVLALRDKEALEKIVKEAVVETEVSSEYEFGVNRAKINQLSESITVQSNDNSEKRNKIGNNSPELQREVASELENNRLPDRDGILVLVTSLKTESGLREYQIWRGLSDKVSSGQLTLVASRSELPQAEKKIPVWLPVLMAVVIIMIVVFLVINLLPLFKVNSN